MIKPKYESVRSAPLHPIVEQALDVLQKGNPGDEKFRLDGIGARRLEVALGNLADTREMATAILELMQFAHFLERQEESPKAASILWSVAFTMMDVLERMSAKVA